MNKNCIELNDILTETENRISFKNCKLEEIKKIDIKKNVNDSEIKLSLYNDYIYNYSDRLIDKKITIKNDQKDYQKEIVLNIKKKTLFGCCY